MKTWIVAQFGVQIQNIPGYSMRSKMRFSDQRGAPGDLSGFQRDSRVSWRFIQDSRTSQELSRGFNEFQVVSESLKVF